MNKVIHKKSTSTINAKGVMKRHFKSALALFMPLLVVSCLTLTSGYILSSSLSGAVETEAITTSVRVLEACSVAADSLTHSTSTVGGGVTTLGTTTFDVSCNDRNGYSLYAVGYGNDTVGNTDLTGATTGSTIPTGTDMSANVSNWAMRLTAVNDSAYFVPTILSDTNGSFTENHVVPSTDTKVVTFKNAIDVSKPSRFTATYTAATTFAQAPDTYTGQVRYTLVHPNYTNADGTTESYAGPLTFTNASSMTIDGVTYTSSSEAPNLTHGEHTITAGTFPTGYEFGSWSATGGISITDPTSATTTINVISAGTLSLNGKPNTYSLSVTFAGSGVSSIQIRTAIGTGGTLMGTVSSSGSSVSGLAYSSTYYLYPVFSSGYELSSWAKTSSYGTLSSTTASNPTFTMGAGNGAVTITGKSSCAPQTAVSGTMQAFCPASSIANGTSGTLIDSRDNNTYTVKKINGLWWMTQNLRFTGTSVPSATSNVTADKTLTYYSLDKSNAGSFGAYSGHCDGTNGYNYACIYDSGSTETGVWYNYYAATAGTVSGSSNYTAASQDICPKNWHLPTGPNATSGTDISNLVGNTASGWHIPTTGLTAFSAVTGGNYYYGTLYSTGCGYWWSAIASSATDRYKLLYDSSYDQFRGSSNSSRYYGIFVRCVRTS